MLLVDFIVPCNSIGNVVLLVKDALTINDETFVSRQERIKNVE